MTNNLIYKKSQEIIPSLLLFNREFIQKEVTFIQGQEIPHIGNNVKLLIQSQVTCC